MFNRADGNIPGIQSFYETGKLIGDTQGWIRGYEAGCRDGALKKERHCKESSHCGDSG